MRTSVAVLLVVGLAGAGCGRAHMSPTFGQANKESYAKQEPPLPKPAAPTTMKLDTQEADVISGSYLRALSGKSKGADPEPVLYVAPPETRQPGRLAPSVPQN